MSIHNIILPLTALVCLALAGCSSTPDNLGGVDGLSPCPGSPNCVSSTMDDGHAIAPIRIDGDVADVMARVEAAVRSLPRSQVERLSGPYLHAVFTSAFFGFHDDLECLYDAENGLLHIRSAARTGYYDFGVNRRRVERLRKLLSIIPEPETLPETMPNDGAE
ncbi:DUF1499 domain-containing protein [Desulfobaculum senezii]